MSFFIHESVWGSPKNTKTIFSNVLEKTNMLKEVEYVENLFDILKKVKYI